MAAPATGRQTGVTSLISQRELPQKGDGMKEPIKPRCSGVVLLAMLSFVMGVCSVRVAAADAPQASRTDLENSQWAVILEGFFPGKTRGGETKRLNCYLVHSDGKWTAALATPTNNGKPVWNTAFMPIDASGASAKDGRLTGTLLVTLAPDPWVPKDQKSRVATITLDAGVTATPGEKNIATLSGSWTSRISGPETELSAALLQGKGEGTVNGTVGPILPRDVSNASYDLSMYNLIPGQTSENFHRSRALSLGVRNGQVVSARLGQMDLRQNAYDYVTLDAPEGFTVTPDSISGSLSFATDTLEGEEAQFKLSLEGRRVHGFVTGTWRGSYTGDDRALHEVSGFFRGNVRDGAFESTAIKDTRPWFVPVKDFKPVAAGEHPRLFFRKSDLPELRRRAATPDGQIIIKRLRELLNGSDGQSMPTIYNPARLAYEKNNFKGKPGAYTITSAVGFGFLYQLTSDKRYAELARQCVEKGFAGQRDQDDRYAWVAPGGELRAGPSIAWYAAAYDLCFDAWDEAFRTEVAKAVQDYSDVKGGEWNNPEAITLRKMILQPRQGPGSNHFGAVIGGSGLAVLAIKGDPGTDDSLTEKYMKVIQRQIIRQLSAGWGDGGYYHEGWGASQVGTNGAFLCLLQAMKVADGHDYLNVDRTNVSYMTMVPRALMLLGPPPVFAYRSNMGPTYGSPELYSQRKGFSHGGHYAEGFGAVADQYKPGLLWVFNHIVEPNPATRDFDMPSLYATRPMLALINWPTFSGISEANPADAMPLATRDHLYEYFVFRNRFKDEDDVVTTVLINLPDGTKPRGIMVWGMGMRLDLGEQPRNVPVTHYQAGQDGSGSIAAGDWAMAIDYSRASGADALIVTNSMPPHDPQLSHKAALKTVKLNGTNVTVLSLSADGRHPEIKVEGERLIAGKQVVTYQDKKFALQTFTQRK